MAKDNSAGLGCLGIIILIVVIRLIIEYEDAIVLFLKVVAGGSLAIVFLFLALPISAAAIWGAGFGILNYLRALGEEMRLERPWVKKP